MGQFYRKTTTTLRGGMNPVPGVKCRIGRRHAADGKPQHGIESGHRVKPPVEPEDVFIEIRLQVVLGNGPMMRAENPRLQVREGEVNHRQMCVGLIGIASEDERVVPIAQGRQFSVNTPAIGSYRRALGDAFRYK